LLQPSPHSELGSPPVASDALFVSICMQYIDLECERNIIHSASSVTELRSGCPGFHYQQRSDFSPPLISEMISFSLPLPLEAIQSRSWGSYIGGKMPEREADQSLPSTAEDKHA